MTICVLGLGYIGLPTASILATRGFDVVGVDSDPRVVAALNKGALHIHEPGLNVLVQSAVQAGKLTVAGTPQPSDVFIIAVPTPLQKGGRRRSEDGSPTPGRAHLPPSASRLPPARQADLSSVIAATEAVGAHLERGNLVILESTSPPGTTRNVVCPILERRGLKAGEDFALAFAAERVLPGRILIELVENNRVVGGINRASAERVRELYSSFVEGTIFLTDATTAEMVKLMENTFRDVNIALANEFSRVADAVGIDVMEAINLANHHPRVNILRPGPGVGGHCIAVDPWFIVQATPAFTPLIQAARAVNDTQPRVVADLVRRAVNDLDRPTIAVLGLTYKADVDDLRESPSFKVIRLLEERGYIVRAHDALAPAGWDGTPDVHAVLKGADAMVILTDHGPYRQLRPWDAGPAAMAHRRLVDTRYCLDHALWQAHGFVVHRLGGGGRIASAPPNATEIPLGTAGARSHHPALVTEETA